MNDSSGIVDHSKLLFESPRYKTYVFYVVPLKLEGAELPLYKVAVQHLLSPKVRCILTAQMLY